MLLIRGCIERDLFTMNNSTIGGDKDLIYFNQEVQL